MVLAGATLQPWQRHDPRVLQEHASTGVAAAAPADRGGRVLGQGRHSGVCGTTPAAWILVRTHVRIVVIAQCLVRQRCLLGWTHC